MDLARLGSLVVLALIDSTSFGTLLIPIWLLLHPGRVRAARMLVFLGTVATFYFAVGVGFVAGATTVLPGLGAALNTRPVLWVLLVLGVAMLVYSFRMKPSSGGGRLARWRERAMTDGSAWGLVGLALTATVVELGSMLPYLAAVGLVATADISAGWVALVMAGYCLVMITPALVLLGLRAGLGHRVEPFLQRISSWLTSSNALAWVVGIVGFLLARYAAARLGLLSAG